MRCVGTIGIGGVLALMMVHCSILIDSDGLTGGQGSTEDASPSAQADSSGSSDSSDSAIDAGVSPDASTLTSFGPPVVVASDLSQPSKLVADEKAVFWIEGDNSIYRRPVTVEGAPSLLLDALYKPSTIALGISSVFFAVGVKGGWSHIYELPKGGGNALKRFGTSVGDNAIPMLSIEGTGTAFAAYGTVLRSNTDGTGVVEVAKAQSGVSAVVLRAPYVYWNNTSGSILRNDGGASSAPEIFATQAPGTAELVADGTTLYWAAADGKLRALRLDQPGGEPTILGADLKSPRGLAVDAAYVYYASATTGEVAAIPKSGGDRVVLATGQEEPYAIAATSTAVFFTNRAAGTLVRVPKK